MNYLAQGQEDARKIKLMIRFTKIGENMESALVDYFARGFSKTDSARLNDIQPSNLTVRIAELNLIAEIYEKIKEVEIYG